MKKRKDSFFGLHFDYHAQPSYGTQGKDLNEDEIRAICQSLRPDFIQIDCKGHPGWASYPSKIGNSMPDFAKDTLALWRKVTREENVALYVHYSGVYDVKYCKEHPEENAIKADGSFSHGTTRTDGSYVDDILIPQLCEVAGEYGVDGAWVDGECWNTCADFRASSLKEFEKVTGIDLKGKLPATPDDEYYYEYREFFCEKFRRYIRHYVDSIHARYPDFQITSNWAFSDYMPEQVFANVDFLSGDLNPYDSLNSARYAARALAQQNMHWDLMSWNFRVSTNGIGACIIKHPKQIMQEAAAVIMLGGGYQNYITQNNDGTPKSEQLLNLSELSAFLREREKFCFHCKPLHQAALLLSTHDRAHQAQGALYSRVGYEKIMGMTSLLCDVGQSLEIVSEHTLIKLCNQYKVIVVPELYYGLEKHTVELLLDYAKNGGNLVLIGKNTCKLFSKSGVPFDIEECEEYFAEGEMAYDNGGDDASELPSKKPYYFTVDSKRFGTLFSPCELKQANGVTNAAFDYDIRKCTRTLASTMTFGKGKISAIGFDVGSQYLSGEQYMHRVLLRSVLEPLYTPIVKVESVNGKIEMVALEKGGNLNVQLLNTAGSHSDPSVSTDDQIPPAVDIELSVALERRPQSILLQPQGTPLPFTYENGRVYFKVDRVDIHIIIQIIC